MLCERNVFLKVNVVCSKFCYMKSRMVEEIDSVHLDDILRKFGLFNRYQIKMVLLLSFAFFTNGMQTVNYIFVTDNISYRCKIANCETDSFYTSWNNVTAISQCYKYESTNDTECSETNLDVKWDDRLVPCDDWVYQNVDSFVSEFQLACQDWKRALVGTIHSLGLMIGLLFQGQLSDKVGRKAAIIIAGMAAAVFGVAKSYAHTYSVFILLELMEATFGDNCSPAFVMSVELVHNGHRLELQVLYGVVFALGGVTMSLAAYSLPYWRHYLRAIYAPSLTFILYCFIMDESPRWLLSKGRKKTATELLLKMARSSGIAMKIEDLSNIQCEEKQSRKSPLRDTFRSNIVLNRFFICLVWWMSCTFISFGLMVNVVSLIGDKYTNFGILSIADIPAAIAMVYTLKKFQRKKPLLLSFILAGLLCFVQPFIPAKLFWLSSGLYFLGKFVATFTFSTVYMYTSELFPTYTRNSMHALCSAIGRVGSILAPMTPLLTQYMESLPTLLIGTISTSAGLVTLFVPDLSDAPLPDNIHQAENIGNCNKMLKEKVANNHKRELDDF
ncbi:hypothetical protein ACJJTC_011345 [Scirpophaga incertulas]